MLLLVGFVLVGFLVGRWPIVLLAFPVWIVHYIGEPRGWWGEPMRRGESAEPFLALAIVFSCLVIAAGVALRKIINRRRLT